MLSLKVEKRNILGRKTKQLRKNQLIPAVVYGHNIKNQHISVPYLNFSKVYQTAGDSSLIEMMIDKGKPVKVLVHDVQYHPTTDKFHHIDFYQIKAGEKITVDIKLKFVGLSPMVKESGGIFVALLDEIKVECLPKDLISEIEVDISKLATFDDVIRVKDLAIPSSIKVLESAEESVCLVEAPRTEEELEALEEKPEEKVEDVAKVEKPAEEGEEKPAEGEEDPKKKEVVEAKK